MTTYVCPTLANAERSSRLLIRILTNDSDCKAAAIYALQIRKVSLPTLSRQFGLSLLYALADLLRLLLVRGDGMLTAWPISLCVRLTVMFDG